MATLAYAYPAARRNQNLTREQATLKLGPVSATFIVVAMVSLLALLYLNQVTKTGVFGYQLSELQQQQKTLMAARDDLSVEAGRLQSLQSVRSAANARGLVPEGQVSYAK